MSEEKIVEFDGYITKLTDLLEKLYGEKKAKKEEKECECKCKKEDNSDLEALKKRIVTLEAYSDCDCNILGDLKADIIKLEARMDSIEKRMDAFEDFEEDLEGEEATSEEEENVEEIVNKALSDASEQLKKLSNILKECIG